MNENIKPTKEMSEALQSMRDYLNMTLFDGALPECFITLTRNKNVIGGYHSKDQWQNEDGQLVAEIGLNSNFVINGDQVTLMNVLLHELLHLEQNQKGTQGRVGYHNQDFADRCKELGLQVTCHDPGREGAETGTNISTELIHDGPAEQALALCDIDLPYYTSNIIDIDGNGNPQEGEKPRTQGQIIVVETETKKGASGSRTKFTCPKCGAAAWGKATLNIMCADCLEHMIGS